MTVSRKGLEQSSCVDDDLEITVCHTANIAYHKAEESRGGESGYKIKRRGGEGLEWVERQELFG